MNAKLDSEIEFALKGLSSTALIYWDNQDADNIGPAYRFMAESGGLNHFGWKRVDGRRITYDEVAGYNIADYFKANGAYSGPDQDGVYPILQP